MMQFSPKFKIIKIKSMKKKQPLFVSTIELLGIGQNHDKFAESIMIMQNCGNSTIMSLLFNKN
jgi:hypothetical protein